MREVQFAGCAGHSDLAPAVPPRRLLAKGIVRALGVRGMVALSVVVVSTTADAQDIEPRAYSNAPVGVNFLVGGYVFTRGGLSFDPSVPVRNAKLDSSSTVLGYARVLDMWGRSGKFDVIVPYTWLAGTADFAGRPIERVVNGFSDTRIRLSVNLYGAPALRLEDFAEYQQDLIIGASFAVTAPTSQYDSSRAVNLGTNRWSFRPELGVSKALGPLTLEYSVGATFFTGNTNFLGGRSRSQEPIASMQGHVIYAFRSGIWASATVSYLTGGRTAIDGEIGDDLQRNWRVGATLSIPLSQNFSARLFGSRGVSTRTGSNYDLIGFALQYRWGGGL